MMHGKHTSAESASPAKTSGRKTKNDLIFILVLLLLAGVATLTLLLTRTEGDTVTVTVDGVLFGEYSLHENRSIEIRCENGYNLLVIEDGRARIESADCPDGICSSHRPITYHGESIICLPNRVVVEIRSRSNQQPDIII